MKKPRYILLILALIAGDVFFFPVNSDARIFGILLLYSILTKRLHWRSQTTFIVTLVLFLSSFLLYVFTDPATFHQPLVPATERLAVWVYLFLVIGVIQKWRE